MAALLASLAAALVLPPPLLRAAPHARSTAIRACTEPAVEPDDGWVTTPSGLRYRDVSIGSGELPAQGAVVKVHYTGTLAADGSEFDSTNGRPPFAFTLGAGRVIPGWDEGIATMRVGGKRTLNIPYKLGYGESGSGSIPPEADLNFECELVGIETGLGAVVATFPGGMPNVVLVSLLLLSFIPYFLPEEIKPSLWRGG
ncbi:hypothetical protein AB1Y20_012516 [Prymnesium parvum]|uniref:peptidylprolyl isomerase n=1 Tax=Prymnesium parvum TaxID=97485 RepID=A0AB34IKX2_PRYPA